MIGDTISNEKSVELPRIIVITQPQQKEDFLDISNEIMTLIIGLGNIIALFLQYKNKKKPVVHHHKEKTT